MPASVFAHGSFVAIETPLLLVTVKDRSNLTGRPGSLGTRTSSFTTFGAEEERKKWFRQSQGQGLLVRTSSPQDGDRLQRYDRDKQDQKNQP